MNPADPDTMRAEMRARWERQAPGWGRQADAVREMGMPVSMRMIEDLHLQPGQRVLELAAGLGDTGFLAAELIQPGGTLLCSDGAEAMVELARQRARALGIGNVEFKQLELEWIDLPTASVDAIICRWGVMLSLDPGAALQEMRRVLAPGGRVAVAVWDDPSLNPWATAPNRALIEAGLGTPFDPEAPGPFALAAPGRLQDMLEAAGFVDVVVDGVALERIYADFDDLLAEQFDLSGIFRDALEGQSVERRAEVGRRMAELLESCRRDDGSLAVPGRSLVGAAGA